MNMATDDADIGRLPPADNNESSSTTQCGGYEFKFAGGMECDFEDIFMCKICHLPSRDPQFSACCGHTFCKSCLDRMKQTTTSNSEVCPVCRDDKFWSGP